MPTRIGTRLAERTDPVDQLDPQLIAQARAFPSCAEKEQACTPPARMCSTSCSNPTSSSSGPASGVTIGGTMPRNGAGRGEFKGDSPTECEGPDLGAGVIRNEVADSPGRTADASISDCLIYRGCQLAGKRMKMGL